MLNRTIKLMLMLTTLILLLAGIIIAITLLNAEYPTPVRIPIKIGLTVIAVVLTCTLNYVLIF